MAWSLIACSTLPAPGLRPELEFQVAASYEFGSNPPTAVQVPASNRDLTVLELSTEPNHLRETFRGGKRFLLLPGNCRLLRLHCRYRIYGYQAGAADLPAPAQLFPGATDLSIQ